MKRERRDCEESNEASGSIKLGRLQQLEIYWLFIRALLHLALIYLVSQLLSSLNLNRS